MSLRFYQWMLVVAFIAVLDASFGTAAQLWRDLAWATVVFVGASLIDFYRSH